MKPLNTNYDVEMDEFYEVKKENIQDIKDFTKEEQKWFDWLLEKLEDEEISLDNDEARQTVKQELTTFVYNILLYRNLKIPQLKDGLYRANKVIKINKLMSQKGGLKPWRLKEIKCAGLYTVHPVWFIDENRLPENMGALSSSDLESLGLPDICLRTIKKVTFKGDAETGTPNTTVYCYLESTPFVESQIQYNPNWDYIGRLDGH